MLPSTASKCLVIAFESGDHEAVKIICPYIVWSGPAATCFEFTEEVERRLKLAKDMRSGKLDDVRRAMSLCVSTLIENGVKPSNDEWLRLADIDAKIFENAVKSWVRSGVVKEDVADMFHHCMSPPPKNKFYAEAPPKVVPKILTQLKIDPNHQDQDGNTFLHSMWSRATHTTRFDIAFSQRDLWWEHTEKLLGNGASAHLKNDAGESVLDMIEYCIEKGLPHVQNSPQILASIKAQEISSQTSPVPSAPKSRARL